MKRSEASAPYRGKTIKKQRPPRVLFDKKTKRYYVRDGQQKIYVKGINQNSNSNRINIVNKIVMASRRRRTKRTTGKLGVSSTKRDFLLPYFLTMKFSGANQLDEIAKRLGQPTAPPPIAVAPVNAVRNEVLEENARLRKRVNNYADQFRQRLVDRPAERSGEEKERAVPVVSPLRPRIQAPPMDESEVGVLLKLKKEELTRMAREVGVAPSNKNKAGLADAIVKARRTGVGSSQFFSGQRTTFPRDNDTASTQAQPEEGPQSAVREPPRMLVNLDLDNPPLHQIGRLAQGESFSSDSEPDLNLYERKGDGRVDKTVALKKLGEKGSYNTPLFDTELISMLSPYKDFVGVIMKNELKGLLEAMLGEGRDRFGFVINSEPNTKEGKHWMACYVDLEGDKSIGFFDPFGEKMDPQIHEDLKEFVEKKGVPWMIKFKENRVKHQAERSNRCGYHCARFLITMFKTQNFEDATDFDSIRENENEAKDMAKSYEEFGYV